MNDSTQQDSRQFEAATELLREGKYFEESRKWYAFVYLNPLAERFYFIIIGLLSLLIFIFSLMALSGLMPLSPNVPFFYSTMDADNEIPSLTGLRASSQQTVDDALLRYYISEYVTKREAYDPESFTANGRFLQNYSEAKIFDEYRRFVDTANPRSPVRRLGRRFTREVEVQSIVLNPPINPSAATIRYTVSEQSSSEVRRSYWESTLRFSYGGLEISGGTDAQNALQYTLPTFSVQAYETKEQVIR